MTKENKNNIQSLHALPLRDVVMFPHMTTLILVGRDKSIAAIEESKRLNLPIFAIAQKNPDYDGFDKKNIYNVGTLCEIVELSKLPDGTLKVILRGILRAKILKILKNDRAFSCQVEILGEKSSKKPDQKKFTSLVKSNVESFSKLSEFNKKITPEILVALIKIRSPQDISHFIMSFLLADIPNKQAVLEENDIIKKLYKTLEIIKSELEISKTEHKINQNIQEKFTKSQKNFYLLEQLKQIKKELGQEGEDDDESETKELKKQLKKLKLPPETRKKCDSELKKLQKMNPFSSESGVVRNYLETIAELPWGKQTKVNEDFSRAEKILDKNHFGLEKIKERILEFIAVQIKSKSAKGPILCLVGAPGVGKTSLAKSIAESLGRKYVKVSLGGVRDESEIRGHRRTYIGAMPGRIIQSMAKAKSSNPLMLLDEIDKMSSDFRGDPGAAMLEVLDPEQNAEFCDHFLEVEYDLSKVMFIATANDISSIPVPLRDRMEIIRLSGYTETEKLNIAKQYLTPKQIKENGLKKTELKISDPAILKIIRNYTFEAGVRNLNREIEKIARKTTKEILTKKAKSVEITPKNLEKFLGVEKFRYGIAKEENTVGVATGLAYTEYGGDLLDIEALKFQGSGKIQITGKLGDVMKESASAALTYIRSLAKDLKIESKKFHELDFHIHVPEGATPKDGPSAGVALCVTLASILTNRAIKKDIAMTGEITLSGRVLAIGGLKEKLLAALRGKIKTVLIPKQNEKDLAEIPEEITKNLKIKPISTVKEALKECLL